MDTLISFSKALPAMQASLFAILLASTGTGCASGLFGDPTGYDSQGCVEGALRRHPRTAESQASVAMFRDACDHGDGGACSALGVAYEAGVGGPADPARAKIAFRQACDLTNARGCANLGALIARGSDDAHDLAAAVGLVRRACDVGELAGCAELGRLTRDGRGVPVDAAKASSLLEAACDGGELRACTDVANALEASAPSRALTLYVRSCVAGEPAACAKLERHEPRPDAGALSHVATR